MFRINNGKLINEAHIVEINVNDTNIEIELITGKCYDIGINQTKITPYVFIEVDLDELTRLAVHLRRY